MELNTNKKGAVCHCLLCNSFVLSWKDILIHVYGNCHIKKLKNAWICLKETNKSDKKNKLEDSTLEYLKKLTLLPDGGSAKTGYICLMCKVCNFFLLHNIS
jgi:hypothetical protein